MNKEFPQGKEPQPPSEKSEVINILDNETKKILGDYFSKEIPNGFTPSVDCGHRNLSPSEEWEGRLRKYFYVFNKVSCAARRSE